MFFVCKLYESLTQNYITHLSKVSQSAYGLNAESAVHLDPLIRIYTLSFLVVATYISTAFWLLANHNFATTH